MIKISNILDCECHLAQVDGVIFDLDDTLYPEKGYVRSGFCAVAQAFPQVEGMEQKLWEAFQNGLPAIDTVLAAEGLASSDNKALALQVYRNHMPAIQVYPGVMAMLQRLQKSKKIGLITDGRPEGQRAKLQTLGLIGFFDKLIITDELGGVSYRKPNETAFRMMQQALDIPFEKMVYIGDNTKKDFIAPQALGMQCIWFSNPDGLYFTKG